MSADTSNNSIGMEIPDPKTDDDSFIGVRDQIGLQVEKLMKQMDNDDSKIEVITMQAIMKGRNTDRSF